MLIRNQLKVCPEGPMSHQCVVSYGGFPPLRKFYVRMGVNLTGFMCLNKRRDDVGTACVNVKMLRTFLRFHSPLIHHLEFYLRT